MKRPAISDPHNSAGVIVSPAIIMDSEDLRRLRAIFLVEQATTLHVEASFDGSAHVVASTGDERRVIVLTGDGQVLELAGELGDEVPWPVSGLRRERLADVDGGLARELDALRLAGTGA